MGHAREPQAPPARAQAVAALRPWRRWTRRGDLRFDALLREVLHAANEERNRRGTGADTSDIDAMEAHARASKRRMRAEQGAIESEAVVTLFAA